MANLARFYHVKNVLSANVKYIDTVTVVYNDIGLLLKSISSSFNDNINYASLPHYLIAFSVG